MVLAGVVGWVSGGGVWCPADDRRLLVRHLHDRDCGLETTQIQTREKRICNGGMAKRSGRGNLGQDKGRFWGRGDLVEVVQGPWGSHLNDEPFGWS